MASTSWVAKPRRRSVLAHGGNSSAKDRVQCSSQVENDACPEGLAPLGEILTALDNPTVECHDIEPKFINNYEQTIVAQDYAVKCSKVCSYSPMKIPKEFGEDWENAGTRLFLGTAIKKWNMETREHKAGRLVVHFRLNHQGNNQLQGMSPVKPGICLKALVKVKANTIRQWA